MYCYNVYSRAGRYNRYRDKRLRDALSRDIVGIVDVFFFFYAFLIATN